jgi:hypothetical protein
MFVQIKRPLSQDETRQLRDLLVEHRLAPQACRDLAFALITFTAIAAFSIWLRRIPEKWIIYILSLFAVVTMAATAARRWLRQIRFLQTTTQLLHNGQVIDEVIESRQIAVSGHNKSALPHVGAVEGAGFFYDTGDGRFFYLWAEWDHTADEPEFPRHRLQVVWDAQRKNILWTQSAGDRLQPQRTLPRELLNYLPSGSVISATMETLEADIQRFQATHLTR